MVYDWLQQFNAWLEDAFPRLWDFINGRDLNYWVTWSGVWYSAIFFTLLAIFMMALKPRANIEKGFTWVMVAMALILVRIIYVSSVEATPVYWSTLLWINLSLAITYASYSVVTDKFVRRRALRIIKHEDRGEEYNG